MGQIQENIAIYENTYKLKRTYHATNLPFGEVNITISPLCTSSPLAAQQLTKTQSTSSPNQEPNELFSEIEKLDVRLAGSLRVGLIDAPATLAGKPNTLTKVLPTQKVTIAP